MSGQLRLRLRIWRQASPGARGRFEDHELDEVSTEMSFLEMLDVLNERLLHEGELPVEFDSDCREGICGTCGFVVNGSAHGQVAGTTVCQLHMRHFSDGDQITIEPFRARAFPSVRDLVVSRGALDRLIAAGGYVSVGTGGAPEANAIPIPKASVESALDAAACIGCGACVAACPNASAALFVGAKVTHLALLPQGRVERGSRVASMLDQAEREGFGGCSNHAECEAVCPKSISIRTIARMRREYLRGFL